MKKIFLYVIIILFLNCSCKTQKINSSNVKKQEQDIYKGKSFGKVSHQYRTGGCNSVIIVSMKGPAGNVTLIPKDKLPDSFDVDGMEIFFDYHPLKMPNPSGCVEGIPAEITNILKK